MKGDFEKNINNKLSNFKIEPSAQVWLDVEEALQQRRKKRMAAWWWVAIPALLFLIGGGIWWMNYNSITSSSKTITDLNSKNINAEHNQKTKSLLAESTRANPVKIDKRIQQNATKITRVEKNKNPMVRQSEDHQSRRGMLPEKGNNYLNTTVEKTEQSNKENNSISSFPGARTASIVQEKTGIVDSLDKSILTASHKKNSSLLTQPSQGKNTAVQTRGKTGYATPSSEKNVLPYASQKDSLLFTTDAMTKPNRKQIPKSKHHWFITASGGFITVKKGTSLFSSNQNYYSAAPSNSVGSGASSGTSSNSYIIPAPNKGYSFEAGFGYSQTLNKNWIASAGLQYRYLQNKQSVGFDSLAINTGQLYFSYIQNHASISNYAHWLQFPVSLSYTFNPSSRYQLQLLGGGSVAWAFSEHWLITDKTNTYYPYHYNNSLNNRVIANFHVGIGLNCNEKFKISILDEQSLTPIHKNSTEKFYWQQFSLQISKPIHISSHQNKPLKK